VLAEDYSVDSRYDLARQVQAVLRETLRMVASVDPTSSLLGELSTLAAEANRVTQMRVYMDGGLSFAAITDACREVVESCRSLVDQDWTTSTQ
jgi:hypothetical protein